MDIKTQVIQEYLAGGTSYRQLSAKYGMSRDVINKWVMINQKFEKIFKRSNPEVFKYSFLQHTTSGNKILAMEFYEWLEI